MNLANTDLVREEDTRPALQPPDRCGYCAEFLQTPHKPDCVCLKKTILLELRVPVLVDAPRYWDEDAALFYYNESSSCIDNLIRDFIRQQERQPKDECLCFHPTVDVLFLREATEEDHKIFHWSDKESEE